MASFGKVLDLFDDRYLELQDVIGNVVPLPTLVPYDEYIQNVLVYRMDTNHEIFLGLIQDFTMRRAHETGRELWTWFVQWEVESSPQPQQPSSPKKLRLDVQQTPQTPRRAPALTIFERRTLDGALMLEEEMLRILIDIVQVASALVPNFIEFLYRWVDYYEGDGKALKAALRWEIPSLWDFEYHPLVLPPEVGKESDTRQEDKAQPGGQHESRPHSGSHNNAAELRRSSPTKKMHARPKPDLAAIELRTCHTEESERLQYREVKFGIQPPKLEQPLPPLINIPRDERKRTKYYAACFKSRQRALYLLLEAGISMRQINNYQKLQPTHPKETPEIGDSNGLRNYQKDAKYAQTHFDLKEKQTKQREISISNKLALEAHIAASYAIPDGAAGIPLIPPTPSYAKRPDMAAAMMKRIEEMRARNDDRIRIVPKPLVGRMKCRVFEGADVLPPLKPMREFMADAGWYVRGPEYGDEVRDMDVGHNGDEVDEDGGDSEEENANMDDGASSDSGYHLDRMATTADSMLILNTPAPSFPRPSLPFLLAPPPPTFTSSATPNLNTSAVPLDQQTAPANEPASALGTPQQATPPDIATYMQDLNEEQVQRLISLFNPDAREATTRRLQESSQATNSTRQENLPGTTEAESADGEEVDWVSALGTINAEASGENAFTSTGPSQPTQPETPGFDANYFLYLRRQQEASEAAVFSSALPRPRLPIFQSATQPFTRSDLPDTDLPLRLRTTTTPDMSQQTQSAQGILAQDSSVMSDPGRQSLASTSQHSLRAVPPPPPTIPSSSAFQTNPEIPSIRLAPPTPTNPVPSIPTLTLPLPGISRNAPIPLSLSPLKTLAPHLLATSPFLPSSCSPSIQIFLPRILIPGNTPNALSTALGNNGSLETDALLLGHEDVQTGALVLSKALFLPVGVWENTLGKVRRGLWGVVETYPFPYTATQFGGKGKERAKEGVVKTCHQAVYDKLAQAYGFMSSGAKAREEDLTKRWRVSRGPMLARGRGAVWEGWAVGVDRGVEMSKGEREGAVVGGSEAFGDGEVDRRREMDELMQEDEDGDDEMEEMDG